MGTLRYALQAVGRNPRRGGAYIFGLTLAVGLFSAILFFVDASSSRMTQAAVAPLPVDLQARSTIGAQDLSGPAAAMRRDPLVRQVGQVRTLVFSGASGPSGASAPGGTVFVIDPGFYKSFPTLRIAAGRVDGSGVMVSQSMARTLGVRLGDQISIAFDQLPQPITVAVTGVVDPSRAPYLFVSTDPAHAGEIVVVPNDVFLTSSRWKTRLAGLLAHPGPGVRPGVTPQLAAAQLMITVHHRALASDPIQARLQVHQLRLRLAKGFPGELAFTNNVGDALKAAGSDALWAKLLLLFLGMPGVALAAYLATYANDLLTSPRRREIALLRSRGTGPGQLLTIQAISSLLIALVSSVLGLALGVGATLLLFGGAQFATVPIPALLGSAAVSLAAGVLLTAVATYLPLRRSLQEEITQGRAAAERMPRRPLWARAYLDVVSLLVAAAIFAVTGQGGGFHPVESAEGASLSLGFFVFLAPLFVWIGATLLLSRVMGGGVSRAGRGVRRVLQVFLGDLGDTAGRTIVRRASRVGGAIVIVALALSFGTSLAIFTRTYHAQKALEARYALGADLRIIPAASSPLSQSFVTNLAQIPGVDAVTPIIENRAVVGSSRQAIYGVEPASLAQVGDFAPGSFVGTTRAAALRALQTNPRGVIISYALASSYDVHVGDPVLFQVTDFRTKKLVTVRTQAVAIVRHFPGSTHDNFLVVNLPLLSQTTGQSTMTAFLVSARSAPSAVADRVRSAFGGAVPFEVRDVDTAVVASGTTLTSLNVDGLARLEGAYTFVIASLGLAIFLLASIGERAREFGTMYALGATGDQVRRFLWAEALTIGGLALAIGVPLGLGLGRIFITLLTALFTVPPAGIVLPTRELGVLVALSLLGMVASALVAGVRLSRLNVAAVLREL